MLARSRPLALRSGAHLQTPLLIPSFSSRGFPSRPDGLSEAATHLEVTRSHLTETLLVSAYDLHHRLLPQVAELTSADHWDTLWATPQLLVVDSGGYELGGQWDGSELWHDEHKPLPFDRDDFAGLVDQLPADRDLLVITWDHLESGERRPDYDSQVAQAQRFAEIRPHLLIDVLLKPPEGRSTVHADDLKPHARLLRFANVIGVTEKELGDTIVERASALALLRTVLDAEGVTAPIHVFGALDPLFVALYFLAGAELFDGLTWLRYGIHDGLSVYRQSASLLDRDFDTPAPVRRAQRQLRYLAALKESKRALRTFAESGGDFAALGHHATAVKAAHEAVLLRLHQLEGA